MNVGESGDSDSSVVSKQMSVWLSNKKSRFRSVLLEFFKKHSILSLSSALVYLIIILLPHRVRQVNTSVVNETPYLLSEKKEGCKRGWTRVFCIYQEFSPVCASVAAPSTCIGNEQLVLVYACYHLKASRN